MEMVIFIGAQASGKSSLYRERFLDSHVRINLDMLRTRHRESVLVNACFAASQRFVVDNTNPTREERAWYLAAAREHRFAVSGYYFQSSIESCIQRNEGRAGDAKIPRHAIVSTVRKLELPDFDEGFEQLRYVRLVDNQFVVEGWKA